jgi:hypothetical protein
LWPSERGLDQLLSGGERPALTTRLGLQRCSRSPTNPPKNVHNLPQDETLLSAPGERVLFGCLFTSDRPTDFEMIYSASEGGFEAKGGAKAKTIPGHATSGLSFFIPDTWTGAPPIEVTFKIRRKSDGALFEQKTWHFGKKEFIPTTITQFEKSPQPVAPGSHVDFAYSLGPKPPPGWTGPATGPFYLHETILERFEGQTCNVLREELKPEFAAAHPELKTSAEIAGFFFSPEAFNASFNVFGKDDAFIDQNGSNGIEIGGPRLASNLKTPKDVVWERIQVFEAQPNVALGRYTIRRTFHHATGALTIEKVGP